MSNLANTEGLHHLFETYFRSGTKVTLWYVGLISSTNFTAVASTDTMASHTGWQEFTEYSSLTRPVWAPDTPGADDRGGIRPLADMLYELTQSAVIKGFFLTSDPTKGGAAGIMMFSEEMTDFTANSVLRALNLGDEFALDFRTSLRNV